MPQQDKREASHCPICGNANQCAMATGKPVSECWCVGVNFAPEALAAIPESAVGKVCICQSCATATGEHSGGR